MTTEEGGGGVFLDARSNIIFNYIIAAGTPIQLIGLWFGRDFPGLDILMPLGLQVAIMAYFSFGAFSFMAAIAYKSHRRTMGQVTGTLLCCCSMGYYLLVGISLFQHSSSQVQRLFSIVLPLVLIFVYGRQMTFIYTTFAKEAMDG